ncbi:MAG: WD40 repeat domain-containing protein [Verrucomicrobiota bacterium]
MTPFLSNQVDNLNPTPGQLSQQVNPERIGYVSGLSFSPDGRQVVSSERLGGRAVRVWNLADGTIEFAFPAVYSYAVMSPVAPIVAVGSNARLDVPISGCVKLYDLEQRTELWALPDTGGLVAFSGDGQFLVTASPQANRLTLWSLSERRFLKHLDSKKSALWTALALAPDGRWMATGQANSPSIELWSVEQERLVHTLPGHAGAVRTLAFWPDSHLLATAGVDQIVRLWSVSSGELTATHLGHTEEIASLAFFPDGQQVASASRDGTVRLWSTTASRSETPWFRGGDRSARLMVSLDSRSWTSTSYSWRESQVCEARPGASSRKVAASGELVRSEGFDDGGRTVVSSMYASEDGRINLEWRSLENLALDRKLVLDGTADRSVVRSFCAAAGLFAMGQANGLVRVWSTHTGKLLRTFGLPDHLDQHPTVNQPVARVAISPDGALLAAGTQDHSQIAVYSVPEDKLLYSHHVRPLFELGGGPQDPGDLGFIDFSPNGKLLASTDITERGIHLWEARTGRELGQLSGHRDHTVQVAFSPDGRTLASTGGDGSLKLWHLPTRREVATLLESGAVGPVAFSPDGTLLIAGVRDEVRIWRAPTLAEIDRQP